MHTMSRNIGEGRGRIGRVLAGLAVAVVVAGCSATQQEAPQLAGGNCALIPQSTCAQLTPGPSGGAGVRYIAPNVPWAQYNKILLNPVTAWGSEKTKVSGADLQELTNYLYNVVAKKLGEKYQLVDQPGPGVLRLQFAITDAETATPALRSVSMIVPQARVLATLKYAATGTYPFVGGAQGELLATDSVTGNVLAAAVDRRVGGGSMSTAAQWQWGDAENAMNKWADLCVTRLQDLQAGKS